jgi:hypothetical protein
MRSRRYSIWEGIAASVIGARHWVWNLRFLSDIKPVSGVQETGNLSAERGIQQLSTVLQSIQSVCRPVDRIDRCPHTLARAGSIYEFQQDRGAKIAIREEIRTLLWFMWLYICWLFNDAASIADYIVKCVRFEVFTAATMKNGVFWDVTPCGSCKSRRFGGT